MAAMAVGTVMPATGLVALGAMAMVVTALTLRAVAAVRSVTVPVVTVESAAVGHAGKPSKTVHELFVVVHGTSHLGARIFNRHLSFIATTITGTGQTIPADSTGTCCSPRGRHKRKASLSGCHVTRHGDKGHTGHGGHDAGDHQHRLHAEGLG